MLCVQPGDGPPNRCMWYGGSNVLLNGQSFDVTKEDRVDLYLGPNQVRHPTTQPPACMSR
jgi:hypothetical protein